MTATAFAITSSGCTRRSISHGVIISPVPTARNAPENSCPSRNPLRIPKNRRSPCPVPNADRWKKLPKTNLFIKPSIETNAVRTIPRREKVHECASFPLSPRPQRPTQSGPCPPSRIAPSEPDANRRQTLKIPVAVRQPPPEDITEKAAPTQKLSRRGLTYRLKSL